MKNKLMFICCLALGILLVTTQALALTNSQIKNHALTYVGQHGGQCKPFVQKVISDLGGALGSGYRQCYLAIGTEITNKNDVTEGDIIQISKDSDPETFYDVLHSAIVVENYFNGRFKIVSSNYCLNKEPDCEEVSVDNWNPFNYAAKYNLQVHFYRLGTTDSPYTFSSHAYTGTGEVEGGAHTDWNYSLPTRKSEFTMGETAKAIIRVENITVKHRWLVEIWQAGKKKSGYAWNWNEVGADGWNASYFWPEYKASSAGNYQFKIYLYLGDDNHRDHIIDLDFIAVKPADWKAYAYDGHGYTGHGPVQGGEASDWRYWLSDVTKEVNEGDTLYGLVRIDQVKVDHRFKVETYRSGVKKWEWAMPDFNQVGSGWDYA